MTFGRADDAIRTKLPRARSLLERLAPLAKVLGESCRPVKRETPLHLAPGSQVREGFERRRTRTAQQ